MRNNSKVALFVSLSVLVGFPFFFLFVSMYTANWGYLAWSILPSFTAGFTGLIVTINQIKKERNSV